MDKTLLLDAELGRRQILKSAGIAIVGVGLTGVLAGCGGSGTSSSPVNQDATILGAAKIAEALATTMYTSIINGPLYASLSTNVQDQNYLKAARDEEMYHYNLLKANTNNTDAQLTYYFPTGMFTDAQTTLNTLITLEEAFIAAYMIGVSTFSVSSLKVLAAQIMGIEAEHRVLARVIANDLGLTTTTGLSGAAHPLTYSNDYAYELTYGLSAITQVVTALTPFLSSAGGYTVIETFNPAYVPTTTIYGTTPS